jgi:hypothetical protein
MYRYAENAPGSTEMYPNMDSVGLSNMLLIYTQSLRAQPWQELLTDVPCTQSFAPQLNTKG